MFPTYFLGNYAPAGDQYWANVRMLMHMDEGYLYNGGTSRTPDRTGRVPSGSTVEFVASPTKFGGGSIEVDQASGDMQYLLSGHSDLILGASDFTIEGWFYLPTAVLGGASFHTFFAQHDGAGALNLSVAVDSSTQLVRTYIYGSSASYIASNVASVDVFPVDVWTHVALVRVGGDFKLFLAGVEQWSIASADAVEDDAGDAFWVGVRYPGGSSYEWGGNINDFRFTHGVGRYSEDFAVPTELFPHPRSLITGTVNITTGPDTLPPFYTGRGLYYNEASPPLTEASGTLNSNTTGVTIQRLDMQVSGDTPSQMTVVVVHTAPFEQHDWISCTIPGVGVVYSAQASFSTNDNGDGYWQTQWDLNTTASGFDFSAGSFPAGTYDFIFE